MEFFRFADVRTDASTLQQTLTLERLADCCEGIYELLEVDGETAKILCLWGEFDVTRTKINGGIRFAMPGCPNALAWTVTTGFPPYPEKVVLHSTINRTEHDSGMIKSLESFIDDWQTGVRLVLGPGNHAAPGLSQIGDLRKPAT